MARSRHIGPANLQNLCSGPAKLCQAFQIGRHDNGTDLSGTSIWIAEDLESSPPGNIQRSPRVGISAGTQHRWRFFLPDSPFLSRR
jgi:DNA-3-methyladenine glycosylase